MQFGEENARKHCVATDHQYDIAASMLDSIHPLKIIVTQGTLSKLVESRANRTQQNIDMFCEKSYASSTEQTRTVIGMHNAMRAGMHTTA